MSSHGTDPSDLRLSPRLAGRRAYWLAAMASTAALIWELMESRNPIGDFALLLFWLVPLVAGFVLVSEYSSIRAARGFWRVALVLGALSYAQSFATDWLGYQVVHDAIRWPFREFGHEMFLTFALGCPVLLVFLGWKLRNTPLK